MAGMLEGNGLIMHMLQAAHSILQDVLKWGPANSVVYIFAKIGVKSFSSDFSQNTSFTFQLLQRFDAMGPDVDSCMGKMKDMYTRSKFYDLKVGNLQEINKNVIPSRSVLE